MWDNNTVVNASNTTAWTLASGNQNANDMCYNISDRESCSINTTWDETAHARFSLNDTNAVDEISDFVWVQVAMDIPETVDDYSLHSGYIWVHFKADN
jgi:hypothetical protein